MRRTRTGDQRFCRELLVTGRLEGKNDINARIDYCGLGIDLRTERPKPAQMDAAVARVLAAPQYAERVGRLRAELHAIDTSALVGACTAKCGVVAPSTNYPVK